MGVGCAWCWVRHHPARAPGTTHPARSTRHEHPARAPITHHQSPNTLRSALAFHDLRRELRLLAEVDEIERHGIARPQAFEIGELLFHVVELDARAELQLADLERLRPGEAVPLDFVDPCARSAE